MSICPLIIAVRHVGGTGSERFMVGGVFMKCQAVKSEDVEIGAILAIVCVKIPIEDLRNE